ncbi:hypothetical protein ACHQM5_003217 [Ranunculus cassubicifolius]
MMRNVLGITDDLSKALQRKRQDIVNAMTLVKVCKQRLQTMRDDGWDSLLAAVSAFCIKNQIMVPKMEEQYFSTSRSPRRIVDVVTNLHHYYADLFIRYIDSQRQELNNRFNEVNSELLLCVACLDPSNSFIAFDKAKLLRFAEFYPNDFTTLDLLRLGDQLENYVIDVRSSNEFLECHFLTDLAKKMVDTKKNIVYPLVFLLITLSLVLPVATATVERAFSAMHIIKSKLRNRMADEWMNDGLITYIEKDIFSGIENEAILQRFQKMKTRRGQLSII